MVHSLLRRSVCSCPALSYRCLLHHIRPPPLLPRWQLSWCGDRLLHPPPSFPLHTWVTTTLVHHRLLHRLRFRTPLSCLLVGSLACCYSFYRAFLSARPEIHRLRDIAFLYQNSYFLAIFFQSKLNLKFKHTSLREHTIVSTGKMLVINF